MDNTTIKDLTLFLVGDRYPQFGGTEIEPDLHDTHHVAPQVNFESEHRQNMTVLSCINQGLLESVHDISQGGLWQTVVEMVLGERGLYRVGLSLEQPAFMNTINFLF